MTNINRSSNLARLPGSHLADRAAGQNALETPLRRARRPARIQLTELFRPDDERKIRLARQVGIRHAIVDVQPALRNAPAQRYVDALRKIRADFQSVGMTIVGVESHPVPAEEIKLGLAGRDEEIDNYIAAIRALAEVGVRMVCYN